MYVRSTLEYCSPVWNPHYDTYVSQIEKVQRRFTRTVYRKFHFPSEKCYVMRDLRLDLLSLEDRRLISDEMTLFKINSETIKTTLNSQIRLNARIRFTRQTNIFYLPTVSNNIEFFAPMLRMQRQHDTIFSMNTLNETLNAFKRYTIHEVKLNRLTFDYSFD